MIYLLNHTIIKMNPAITIMKIFMDYPIVLN